MRCLAEFEPLLADTATSVLSYLGALLIGAVGGATLGALITASHERAERSRDRMLDAATNYLAAVYGMADALIDLSNWAVPLVRGEQMKQAGISFDQALIATTDLDSLRAKVDAVVAPHRRSVRTSKGLVRIVVPHSDIEEILDEIDLVLRAEREIYTAPKQLDSVAAFEQTVDQLHQRRAAALRRFAASARAEISRRWL